MMSKTHIATGIAASLVILQPTTLGGLFAAVIGGAVGGDVCDIDCKPTDYVRDALHGRVIVSTIVSVMLLADYLSGAGLCASVASNVGPGMALGIISLITAGILGYISKHRSFAHSILGLVWMTASMWLVCPMLAPSFAIGFVSHIALDLLNKKKIQLLYPLRLGALSLGLCRADGLANRVLMCVAALESVALFMWRLDCVLSL